MLGKQACFAIVGALCGLPLSTSAQSSEVNLFPPPDVPTENQLCPEAYCVAEIDANRGSDDEIEIECYNLPPSEDFTLFLGASQATGSLPAVFIGRFVSSRSGRARIGMELEVIESFVALPSQDNELPGFQCLSGRGAGALNQNPVAYPLDFLRVYLADPSPMQTIFAESFDRNGGGICLTSDPIN